MTASPFSALAFASYHRSNDLIYCTYSLPAALVNDTVGTLLAHSYKNPNTFIGAIFGTGTNGAYIEDTKNIKSLSNSKEQEMAINIEW